MKANNIRDAKFCVENKYCNEKITIFDIEDARKCKVFKLNEDDHVYTSCIVEKGKSEKAIYRRK